MLRRTKIGRGDELGLPPRIVYTRRNLFSREEEDLYEALYSGARETQQPVPYCAASRTKFVGYVEAGTLLNSYAHIFELLIRMRLAANHPWLVTLRPSAEEVKYPNYFPLMLSMVCLCVVYVTERQRILS
jgi:DNA repair protein RAD16